jgi:hypothetical protein
MKIESRLGRSPTGAVLIEGSPKGQIRKTMEKHPTRLSFFN